MRRLPLHSVPTRDLVDALADHRTAMASVAERIETYRGFQPAPLAAFHAERLRLRAILDAHLELQTLAVP